MTQNKQETIPATSSRRLISNTAWNVTALVANALIGFWLIRFFLKELGPARYGVWVLIGSLFRYRGIVSMGMNSALNRFIPMYLAHGDRNAAQRAISTALGLYLLMAGVLLGLTAILNVYVGIWFVIPQDLVPTAQHLVVVVGLGFAIVLPLQLATAVLSGSQRYDLVNSVILGTLLIRTAILVVLLRLGYGLLTMGILFGLSEIMIRLFHWQGARRRLPGIDLAHPCIDMTLMRQMLAYGTNTFLYVVGGVVIIKVSDLLIGASALGMEGVTQFSIAAAAVSLLAQLIQAFTKAIMPAVSDLNARHDQSTVRELALLVQKYSLVIILPAVLFLTIMGKSFLVVWVGDEIGDDTTLTVMSQILALLAIGHGVRLAQHSNFLVLVGCGDHKIFGRLSAGTVVLVVGLSVAALWLWQGGLLGVAWANTLPLLLVSGLILPRYAGRKLGITLKERINRVWKPVMLGSLPGALIIVLWQWLAPPPSWFHIGAVVVVVATAMLLGTWGLSLDSHERLRFKQLIFGRGAASHQT
ncbi:lipopolysaccharide biosynthesis protein [Planctomycetota bacterium]